MVHNCVVASNVQEYVEQGSTKEVSVSGCKVKWHSNEVLIDGSHGHFRNVGFLGDS